MNLSFNLGYKTTGIYDVPMGHITSLCVIPSQKSSHTVSIFLLLLVTKSVHTAAVAITRNIEVSSLKELNKKLGLA